MGREEEKGFESDTWDRTIGVECGGGGETHGETAVWVAFGFGEKKERERGNGIYVD